ncbi:MAG: DNA translocase FtsK, partial [Treponema sp.]|nr:DNA translocase FtsK [Treponema sp.]
MKNQKYSVAAGIVLFVLAALFSISLLLVAFDFGGINPAKNSPFYSLGKMFTGVYGLSSVCIPIFLIVAGIQCFSAKWRLRNGVMLLGSVIPFFTLDAIEHICRMLLASDSDSVLLVKMSSTLLIGALILAAEYLLLSILGDVL